MVVDTRGGPDIYSRRAAQSRPHDVDIRVAPFVDRAQRIISSTGDWRGRYWAHICSQHRHDVQSISAFLPVPACAGQLLDRDGRILSRRSRAHSLSPLCYECSTLSGQVLALKYDIIVFGVLPTSVGHQRIVCFTWGVNRSMRRTKETPKVFIGSSDGTSKGGHNFSLHVVTTF